MFYLLFVFIYTYLRQSRFPHQTVRVILQQHDGCHKWSMLLFTQCQQVHTCYQIFICQIVMYVHVNIINVNLPKQRHFLCLELLFKDYRLSLLEKLSWYFLESCCFWIEFWSFNELEEQIGQSFPKSFK